MDNRRNMHRPRTEVGANAQQTPVRATPNVAFPGNHRIRISNNVDSRAPELQPATGMMQQEPQGIQQHENEQREQPNEPDPVMEPGRHMDVVDNQNNPPERIRHRIQSKEDLMILRQHLSRQIIRLGRDTDNAIKSKKIVQAKQHLFSIEEKYKMFTSYKNRLHTMLSVRESIEEMDHDNDVARAVQSCRSFVNDAEELDKNSNKLPKLELSKFSGNLVDWTLWWNPFKHSIHENRTLDVNTKLSHLRSLTTGRANEAIRGFDFTLVTAKPFKC